MYSNLKSIINLCIENTRSTHTLDDTEDEKKKIYILGMEAILKVVESEEDFAREYVAYETLEDTLKYLKDELDYYDVVELVDEVFEMEDDE